MEYSKDHPLRMSNRDIADEINRGDAILPAGVMRRTGAAPSTVAGGLSPIMERLSLLIEEIDHAHANMSELEHRLTPVRAVSPPGEDEKSAAMAGPSEVEDRLTMAYNHVRGLNARITTLRSELRI